MTHQPGVYVPLRALFLVAYAKVRFSHDATQFKDTFAYFSILPMLSVFIGTLMTT